MVYYTAINWGIIIKHHQTILEIYTQILRKFYWWEHDHTTLIPWFDHRTFGDGGLASWFPWFSVLSWFRLRMGTCLASTWLIDWLIDFLDSPVLPIHLSCICTCAYLFSIALSLHNCRALGTYSGYQQLPWFSSPCCWTTPASTRVISTLVDWSHQCFLYVNESHLFCLFIGYTHITKGYIV